MLLKITDYKYVNGSNNIIGHIQNYFLSIKLLMIFLKCIKPPRPMFTKTACDFILAIRSLLMMNFVSSFKAMASIMKSLCSTSSSTVTLFPPRSFTER